MKQKFLLVIISFAVLNFISCREEIISPANPVTNINEPVQYRSTTSYRFLLNAKDITYTVKDYPALHSSSTQISVSISGETAGRAEILFYNFNNQRLYSFNVDSESKRVSRKYSGDSPEIVEFRFINFSGQPEVSLIKLQ